MKCQKCGNEIVGIFCEKCNEPVTEEGAKLQQKVKASFVDENEKLISILGTNTAKTFFSTGLLGNGFATLSNKRMYFKGQCYFRSGKHFIKKTEERIVDLKDITGTGFVHKQSIVVTFLYFIVTLFGISFVVPGIFWLIYIISKKTWAHTAAHIINPFSGLLYLMYKSLNYNLFEVAYASGSIAFDLAWITREDCENFQRALQKLKDEYSTGAVNKQSNPTLENSDIGIPAQIKQYKDLLDSGVITQEEFEAKKKQLLGI